MSYDPIDKHKSIDLRWVGACIAGLDVHVPMTAICLA